MRYVVSDLHGELSLFERLLKRIGFSADDEMFVCGDLIEKGERSIALAKYVLSFPNIRCVLGNHELAFLKYYHSLSEMSPDDFDAILGKLQAYFPEDGYLLDWDLVDRLEALPAYIEEDDFICVHAGIPLDGASNPLPLCKASPEELVNDRRFKDPHLSHNGSKCVFFGHTHTDCICGEPKLLGYRRRGERTGSIRDYYKVHLDTGAWKSGVLGCFCIDTQKAIYIKK